MAEPVTTELEPWEPLSDAVAWGMWLYSRAAFRVETLGELRPEPGLLLVSTHRAESDVPVICPSVYARCRFLLDRRAARLSFAARDDMFDRGFFAGFPDGLPLRARRLLYPLRAGPYLPRVRVHPIPYPGVAWMRVGWALERLPAAMRLDEAVPQPIAERFRVRAAEAGREEPRSAADALHGVYADLLWTYCSRDELTSPEYEELWRARASDGAAALRRLIEYARTSGEMLLLFPEGKPSEDGSIGPLQPGLDLFVRRARPAALKALSITYDPLVPGRPRAVVAFGPRLDPAVGRPEERMLEALRATMPLTAGSLVAHELVAAANEGRNSLLAGELDRAAAEAVASALAEGRPVERALRGQGRRARLSETLAALIRRRVLTSYDCRRLELAPERLLADPLVGRSAREYESARYASL
jgi:1-acyl-sn-glycerol-3-phosphate acyltransferase